MRNNNDSTAETFNSASKGTKRFAIEVVGRLVKDEDMRLIPHSSGQNNLHLLSSRKGGHTVVGTELTVKTAILQMLFDVLGGKRTDVKTGALGNLEIDSLHGLLPSHLLQSLLGQEVTVTHGGSKVADLILVFLGLVGLTTAHKLRDDLLDLGDLTTFIISELDLVRSLLQLFFLWAKLHCNLDERFLVLSVVGVTPTDVLVRSSVNMLFNVMESMLGNVGDTGVRVLPDITSLWLGFSDKKLDHGTLSGTVLTNTGDTGGKGDLDSNVEEGWGIVTWVGEVTTGHLHEGLTLRLDTFDRTRLWELERLRRGLEGEESTNIRVDLGELVEVTLEGTELQVLN
mmetsp:Transcript_2521/g.4014  ORF Transcript_2521/g.4014 Transcript_2521/m.4014 type:complete len:342 (+) Transcript_2521:888-1913(+)